MRFSKLISYAVMLMFASHASWALPTTVTPEQTEIRCTKDSDCIEASNSCDGCCQKVAINKASQVKFESKVRQCQKDWMSQQTPIVCDCSPTKSVVKCSEKKCVLHAL